MVVEAFTLKGRASICACNGARMVSCKRNPVSRRNFAAFGQACRSYRAQREVLESLNDWW